MAVKDGKIGQMKIGLDMASLALKRRVSTVVVVTGDSHLIPAVKLAWMSAGTSP